MIDWKEFSLPQQRYIVYMLSNPDALQKDAAKALGITTRAIELWPPKVKEAIAQSFQEVVENTKTLMESKMYQAVMVLSKQMDSSDERVAQAAAVKLLEWSMGKPSQVVGIDKNQNEMIVRVVYDDSDS